MKNIPTFNKYFWYYQSMSVTTNNFSAKIKRNPIAWLWSFHSFVQYLITQLLSADTLYGVNWFIVFPNPNCPFPLYPQLKKENHVRRTKSITQFKMCTYPNTSPESRTIIEDLWENSAFTYLGSISIFNQLF